MGWLGQQLGRLYCKEVKEIFAQFKLKLTINKFDKRLLVTSKGDAILKVGTQKLVNQPILQIRALCLLL